MLAQATNTGKDPKFIRSYGDNILMGYGDWTANTGPVAVVGFNAESAAEVNLLDPVPSESLDRIRILGGKVYLPWTDPQGANAGFTTNESGVWANVDTGLTGIHVFDVTMYDGDLYLCGSDNKVQPIGASGAAAVWRRLDGVWSRVFLGDGENTLAGTRCYTFLNSPPPGYNLAVIERSAGGSLGVWASITGNVWVKVTGATEPPAGDDTSQDIMIVPEEVRPPNAEWWHAIGYTVSSNWIWLYNNTTSELLRARL